MTTYRIKQLEWRENYGAHYAHTPFCRFCVVPSCRAWSAMVVFRGTSDGLDYHDTEAAAKAACNDHWESLMKQALEEV